MIAILDYGAGNLTSVELAFRHIGAKAVITDDPSVARDADSLVFPGVGSAASGMAGIYRSGFNKIIADSVAANKPVLAVCLGMQMLLSCSAEDGGVAGLDIISGRVELFDFSSRPEIKVPHMGWNEVSHNCTHPLLFKIRSGEAFYFVHSYYAAANDPAHALGKTEYGGFEFTSIIGRGSLFATQFHPERSGEAGLQLLKNFADWDGSLC